MRFWRSITSSALLLSVVLTATGAREFNGSNQYLNIASSHGVPITIAAWIYADSTASAMAVGSVTSGSLTRCQLGLGTGGLPNATTVNTGGTSASAQGASGISAGTWYHLVGTFTSSTDRKVFLDGVQQAANTTSITLGTVNRTTIGMRVASNAVGLFWDGRIAEFAVWNATLSDAEIASLAAGAKPIRVRPASLRVYVPLAGEASPEINFIGTAATLTNAPTSVAHPRVY